MDGAEEPQDPQEERGALLELVAVVGALQRRQREGIFLEQLRRDLAERELLRARVTAK